MRIVPLLLAALLAACGSDPPPRPNPPPDTTAPTSPAALAALPLNAAAIKLQWSAASDDRGVSGYRVYRNGTAVGTATVPGFTDTGLGDLMAYCYTVTARDAAGNESEPSAARCATTAKDLSAEFASENGSEHPSDLAWDGEYLWVANYAQGAGEKKIYRYAMAAGPAIGEIPTPSEWSGSLSFVNGNLWLIDYLDGSRLFTLSPADGAVLASYPVDYLAYPGGSAWDGVYLYYAESAFGPYGPTPPSHIYKVDTLTGSVLDTVYTTNTYAFDGLACKDGSLWALAVNTARPTIVNISTEGAELGTLQLPVGEAAGAGVGGLENIAGDLWYLRRGITEVYAVKFTP